MKKIFVRVKETNYEKTYGLFVSMLSQLYSISCITQIPEELSDVLIIINFAHISDIETKRIHAYLETGGSILYFLNNESLQNFYLFAKYGVSFAGQNNTDGVVISLLPGIKHPKEAVIYFNQELDEVFKLGANSDDNLLDEIKSSIIYPFGRSLSISNQAKCLLHSGKYCYPQNAPLCSLHIDKESYGKFCVVGSSLMCHDNYIKSAQNEPFINKLVLFLIDGTNAKSLAQKHMLLPSTTEDIPDIASLSEMPKLCVSFNNLNANQAFNLDEEPLFSINPCKMITNLMKMYEMCNVEPGALSLIKPTYKQLSLPLKFALHSVKFPELVLEPSLEALKSMRETGDKESG